MRGVVRSALVVILMLCAVTARADAQFDRLFELLKIKDYVAITRAEGVLHNGEIASDLLGSSAMSVLDQIDRIHDAARLEATIKSVMAEALSPQEVGSILAFLDTDAGDSILELELAARQAMSEPEFEDLARAMWREQVENGSEKLTRIQSLSDSFDLVDRNTSGALNAQLLFFRGINIGQEPAMSEEEMIAEVYSQEPAIRDDTESWLGGYMWLAYGPLDDAVLNDYVTFAKTDAGQALNNALFDGFNTIYDELAFATGQVIGFNMRSSDL